jgi:hypothetical protein
MMMMIMMMMMMTMICVLSAAADACVLHWTRPFTLMWCARPTRCCRLSRCAQSCRCRCNLRVTRHTSHVTRHTSPVTRHPSHVTRHTSCAAFSSRLCAHNTPPLHPLPSSPPPPSVVPITPCPSSRCLLTGVWVVGGGLWIVGCGLWVVVWFVLWFVVSYFNERCSGGVEGPSLFRWWRCPSASSPDSQRMPLACTSGRYQPTCDDLNCIIGCE